MVTFSTYRTNSGRILVKCWSRDVELDSERHNKRLQTDVALVNILPCVGTLEVPGFAWRCFLWTGISWRGPRG